MQPDSKTTRILTIGIIALTALSVFTLAWPRLKASYRYIPVDIAIKRYYSTREIPTERLPVLIRFAGEAIEHNNHYRYHDGLSLLNILRAMDINTPVLERRAAYIAAQSETVAALKRGPAQPALWQRLSHLRWVLHDEPENIIAAWKMSIFTGRTDNSLIVQRIEIGLSHKDYLDEEATAMLRDQMLLGWRLKPGSLIQVLSTRDSNLSVTRELIGNAAPTALTEMEAWLAKIR